MKRAFASIGFSSAIILLVLNLFANKYIFILTIGLAALFAASLVLMKYRKAVVVPLILGSALFSCLLFSYTYSTYVEPQQKLDSKTATVVMYVTSDSLSGDNYYAKTEFIDCDNCDSTVQNVKVLLNCYTSKNIEPYKEIKAKATFNYASIGTSNFSSDKVFLVANCSTFSYTGKDIKSLNKYALKFRQLIKRHLSDCLQNPYAALSTALVVGDKSDLPAKIITDFRYAGISSIMAISGLHLTIITGVLLLLLKIFKVNKKATAIITSAFVLLYMAVSCYTSSVVRSGIMMLVLLCGNLFKRRADSLNSLGVALFVICINPFAVTDVGLVLSVLAVLSIIVMFPIYSKYTVVNYKDPLNKTAKERLLDIVRYFVMTVFTSFAVVLFITPATYYFFGYANIVTPAANVVASPIGSACIVMSFLTFLISLSGITPLVSIAAFVTEKLESLLISSADFFASFSGSIVKTDRYFGFIIAGVFIIFALGFLMYSDNSLKISAFVSLAFVIAAVPVLTGVQSQYSKVYVSSNGVVVTEYKGKTVVWGVDGKSKLYDAQSYLTRINENVDILIVDESPIYSAKLSESVGVHTVLCNEFDQIVLDNISDSQLEVVNHYNVRLDDNYKLCYNNKDVKLDINGFTVGTTPDCDLYINNRSAVSTKGTVYIKDGDLEYTIKDKSTFSVRRINEWQK